MPCPGEPQLDYSILGGYSVACFRHMREPGTQPRTKATRGPLFISGFFVPIKKQQAALRRLYSVYGGAV